MLKSPLHCYVQHKDRLSPPLGWLFCSLVNFFRANWYSQAQAVPKVGLSTILRGSERTNISALPSTGFSDPIIQVGHNTRPPIIHVTEPIGTAKPKFSLKSDSQTFTELSGEPTALLCPAQASPLPTVRY